MDVPLHSRTLIAICQRRKSSGCGSFLNLAASRRPGFLFERFERPSMAEAWGKPLKMSTKVNGEIRQNSDTSDLYFGIEALVAYASRLMTILPGDIIGTGFQACDTYYM